MQHVLSHDFLDDFRVSELLQLTEFAWFGGTPI